MLKKIAHNTKISMTSIAIAIGFSVASGAHAQPRSLAFSPTDSSPTFINAERHPDRLFREGLKAFKAGNYAVAEVKFQEHLNLHARSAPTQFMLGRTYIAVGEWAQASQTLESALHNDRDHHGARYLLAVSYLQEGSLASSGEQLGKLDHYLTTCDDHCDPELVYAVGLLRTALTEQSS